MNLDSLIAIILTAVLTAGFTTAGLIFAELVKSFIVVPIFELWKLKGEISATLLAFSTENVFVPFEKTPEVSREYRRLAGELRARVNSTPLRWFWMNWLFCDRQALEAAAALKHLATWDKVGAHEAHMHDFIRGRLRIRNQHLDSDQQNDLYKETLIPPEITRESITANKPKSD